MSINKTSINNHYSHNTTGRLSFLQCDSLMAEPSLSHFFFTREGGTSPHPYTGLNVSYNTGDQPDNVHRNLQLIKNETGASRVISVHQVHGTEILILRKGNSDDPESPAADAIITDIPSLGIMVKQADCQGIILYDRVRSVVAVVHSGWRGNVLDIIGVAVRKMESEFGCEPENILAAIGPSLGPCCAEFTSWRDIFPPEFQNYMVKENMFDLWEISRMQLIRAGLMEDNIRIAGICTKCNTDLFYSYRGEGETGRFGTVAMIR
jgi:polyphenol oxidase